ncbi:MAG TPA: hypothetical protein VJP77_00010, partial [Planctomycetota bacterium]|nr:hypothetical protein [Planctomycetota bacterium]
AIPAAGLLHDESALAPVLNDMPSGGTDLGGNQIVIEGLGFFPAGQVHVLWGALSLGPAQLVSVAPDRIELVAPPGSGTVVVRVQTPNGLSNARTYAYSPNGPVPISFAIASEVPFEKGPTVGAFGPDGRYYAGLIDGRIAAVEFDDAWNVVSKVHYPGVSGLPNPNVLGIAFDPFDPYSGPGDTVRVLVAHGQHFVNGGTSFVGPSPYTGQVSALFGPAFDAPVPLLTGLPTSNHDHAVNALEFDHEGDLLVLVGSNTNAGVAHPNSGDLPESPLSAALLRAETSRPDFQGAVQYVLSEGGAPSADQVQGEQVDVAPGAHVSVYAAGLRNAFDIVLHTNGRLYATDNGPNVGYGGASTGPDTEGPDPFAQDELLLVEPGRYYGAANRNRGRHDPRENAWRSSAEATEPGVYAGPIAILPSSTNGLAEYRSAVFGGQLRGDLVVQKWANTARRIDLSPDGRKVLSVQPIGPWTGGLSLEFGSGGALLVTDYGNKRTKVLVPNDVTPPALRVLDVTPWRGLAAGGQRFVLAGVGFGTLANTTVTFGGLPASL